MTIELIKGPFIGKGDREFCIVLDEGRRRKINYAKYVCLKHGKQVSKYDEVHHKDENRHNNSIENLEVIKEYKHKRIHSRSI